MTQYKIVRHFIDKKTACRTRAQYGPTVTTAAEATALLLRVQRNHPGFVFEVCRG